MVAVSPRRFAWSMAAFPATVLFVDALALAIVATIFSHHATASEVYRTGWEYAMLIACALGLIVGLVRRRDARLTWEVTGAVASLVGLWYAPALLLPVWIAILVSAVLTVVTVAVPVLRTIVTCIGDVGMAFAFAAWIPIEALIVGLAVLTTYDMVAGSHGHSVQALLERLGPKAFLPHVNVGAPMGVADIAIPCAVVLAVAPFGIWIAALVAVGGVIGAAVAAWRDPRLPHAEYVTAGTLFPAIAVLLFRILL